MNQQKIKGLEKEIKSIGEEIAKHEQAIKVLRECSSNLESKVREEVTEFKIGEEVLWRRMSMGGRYIKIKGIVTKHYYGFNWIQIRPFNKDGIPSKVLKVVYHIGELMKVDKGGK